jgi:hypothetical protein
MSEIVGIKTERQQQPQLNCKTNEIKKVIVSINPKAKKTTKLIDDSSYE